jgi:hypothetical protein
MPRATTAAWLVIPPRVVQGRIVKLGEIVDAGISAMVKQKA